MKRLLLIVNTRSGKAKAKNHFYKIVDMFDESGYLVVPRITRFSGHGIELSKSGSLSGDYDCIVCVGGDGTLNEAINGVLSGNSEIPVGYIPTGSTNDFAASMNIDSDIFSAVEKIINGAPYPIDAGMFNKRYFSYIATFGAFTSTSYNTPQSFKNILGHTAYVLGGIKDITAIQPYNITVKTENDEHTDEYIFGAVCNSTSVGGIVKLDAGSVDMNDGLFEVILIRKPKNIVELNEIIWKIASSDFSGKMIEFFKTSDIIFKMPQDIPWSVDGERVDGTELVEIQNIHNALKFIR